jgi:outer membrane protein assembly factor BamB
VAPPDAVIDLDRLAAEQPPPAPRRRSRRRRLLTVTVSALALLVPAAAAAPPVPLVAPVRTVWIASNATYHVIGDTLYVIEDRAANPRLTAYPLPGGEPRWSVQLAALSGQLQLAELGDVVVVGAILPGPAVSPHTEALDRGTGVVRWTSPLWPAALDRVRNRVVLGEPVRIDLVEIAPAGDLVAVAAGTGKGAWTYHRPAGCLGALPATVTDPRTPLAVLCEDGGLSAVDLDTGRLRTSTRVGPTGIILGSPAPSVVAALADRILVSYPVEAGGWSFASYDPATLRPQWTMHLRFNRPGVAECGPRLCLVNSPDLLGVDPGTGAVAWQLVVSGTASPVAGGYVLVEQPSGRMSRLVDAGTGRVLLTFVGWTVQAAEGGPPVFYRSDAVARRLWVAVLDAGRSGLRVLGSVAEPDGDTAGCAVAGRYLVCRTVKDAVQVWRISVPG